MVRNNPYQINLQAKNNNAEDHKEDKTAKQGYGWFMPDGHSAAGRAGAIIEEGGKVGLFIDKKLPSGHRFAVNHDKLVDFLVKEHKIPDIIANIPTMPAAFIYSLFQEDVNTRVQIFNKLFGTNITIPYIHTDPKK